jgi:hypothetical protein
MRHPVSCLLALLLSMSCNGSQNPAAPRTPPGPPLAPPGTSPNAIRIELGQNVSGVVAVSDPVCDAGSPTELEPCQRFAVAIPTSGVLRVQVTSTGPSGLTLRVGFGVPSWGVTALSGAVAVQAGSTYEISVSLHDARAPSQAFALTTSLEPR